MAERTTDEDLELLGNLGVETESASTGGRTPKEQRIMAGFGEIERWIEEHGRQPQHGENRDIFERLYAVRLDRLRASPECRVILENLDSRGLLGADFEPEASRVEEDPSDATLLESLGVSAGTQSDITELVHVRARDEIKAAEEVAQRNPCADFGVFKPLFETVRQDLASGARRTLKYQDNAEVNQGDLFVLDGQTVVVADMGDSFVSDYGRPDRRLRVVYDNGTESDLLVRSLQRALNKDKASRRITKPDLGPLFSDQMEADDVATGCIYVLRSKSEHPFIAEHRKMIHKIGVTSGEVKGRIAHAKKDPTYLLAEVEVVATFKLANMVPNRMEALLHKFFSGARLDVELKDRFGANVEPREWYFLPLSEVERVVDLIADGTVGNYRFDVPQLAVVPR